MVIAHHLVWTAYGCWLPNDPRGSMSQETAWDEIAELGESHYGRKRIQPPGSTIREFYKRADDVLKYPRLVFDAREFQTVADALQLGIQQRGYTCYACAVMPDHVHLVIRKHRDQAETMIDALQDISRQHIVEANLRTPDHPVWTSGGFKGFLNTPADVRREIRYVEQNPLKRRLPAQRWPFVIRYDDWPYHQRSRARDNC